MAPGHSASVGIWQCRADKASVAGTARQHRATCAGVCVCVRVWHVHGCVGVCVCVCVCVCVDMSLLETLSIRQHFPTISSGLCLAHHAAVLSHMHVG